MVRTISVKRLRENLAGVLKGVTGRLDRYIISKYGEPEAVLMCVDDYEGWLETLEIVSSKASLDDIKKARRELKEGKGYSFEEVFGDKGEKAKGAKR